MLTLDAVMKVLRRCRTFVPAGVLLVVAVAASLGPHLQGFPAQAYPLLTGVALGAAAVALLQSILSLNSTPTASDASAAPSGGAKQAVTNNYPSSEQLAALIKGRRSIFPKDFTGAFFVQLVKSCCTRGCQTQLLSQSPCISVRLLYRSPGGAGELKTPCAKTRIGCTEQAKQPRLQYCSVLFVLLQLLPPLLSSFPPPPSFHLLLLVRAGLPSPPLNDAAIQALCSSPPAGAAAAAYMPLLSSSFLLLQDAAFPFTMDT
jgi:hypothetical protein